MSSSNNLLLEAKGITKYFGTITALENVNLKVSAGECLGVVGDNGAGKSTLMKVLSGLYKPSAGSLHFQGKEEVLGDLEEKEREYCVCEEIGGAKPNFCENVDFLN